MSSSKYKELGSAKADEIRVSLLDGADQKGGDDDGGGDGDPSTLTMAQRKKEIRTLETMLEYGVLDVAQFDDQKRGYLVGLTGEQHAKLDKGLRTVDAILKKQQKITRKQEAKDAKEAARDAKEAGD